MLLGSKAQNVPMSVTPTSLIVPVGRVSSPSALPSIASVSAAYSTGMQHQRSALRGAPGHSTAHAPWARAFAAPLCKPCSANLAGTHCHQRSVGSSSAQARSPAHRLVAQAAADANAGSSKEGEAPRKKTVPKVAHQGCAGAYSEVAARRACPEYEPLPCEQFEVAFQALSQWIVDRAVQPIENSLGGSIHAVYDLLIRYRVHIIAETSLKINHCLCALPGTKKENITKVLSHPQALAQCDTYIRALGASKGAVDDTATGAQVVASQKLQNVGAICSSRAAELYGLEIIEAGIQDVKDNVTRFVVLSRDPLISTERDTRPFKTSIVFSLLDGPGMLFKALAVFALRDLDLLKIESRPLRNNPLILVEGSDGRAMAQYNYLFYLDFVGKLSDENVQNAMRHLQETAPFVRVLGSFPMDTDLGSMNVETMFDKWADNGGPGAAAAQEVVL